MYNFEMSSFPKNPGVIEDIKCKIQQIHKNNQCPVLYNFVTLFIRPYVQCLNIFFFFFSLVNRTTNNLDHDEVKYIRHELTHLNDRISHLLEDLQHPAIESELVDEGQISLCMQPSPCFPSSKYPPPPHFGFFFFNFQPVNPFYTSIQNNPKKWKHFLSSAECLGMNKPMLLYFPCFFLS